MSVLALSTAGLLGDVSEMATVGVLPALPPLPIEVVIAAPAQRAHVPAPHVPRPTEPGRDPCLRLLAHPECSLVEEMAETVDAMNQLAVDFGVRPYEVWSVVVRWSGGERGRGAPSVVWEQPFLPVPKLSGVAEVNRDLRAGGAAYRGSPRLEKLSPRYTEDDILQLFPRELAPGEEHFIEARLDGRGGSRGVRSRYVVSGKPERRSFDWTVRLTKQDPDRERDGRPQ